MSEIIKRMMMAFAEHGVVVPEGIGQSVEMTIRQELGGERVYVPALPKQRHNRIERIARQEKRTQAETATALGISIRQVRRIQRGK